MITNWAYRSPTLNNSTLTNTFPVTDLGQLKQKVLNWIQRFNTFCLLDNHQYAIQPHTQECILGAGIKRKVHVQGDDALDRLQHFIDEKRAYLFGHLCYDLITEPGQTSSTHPDLIRFPDLFFFEPEIIIRLNEKEIVIEAEDPEEVFVAINSASEHTNHQLRNVPVI